MVKNVGILVFPDVEELDFVGPLEVYGMLQEGYLQQGLKDGPQVKIIGTEAGPIRCAKGMSVNADATIDEVDELDILIVPGGWGTRPLQTNDRVLDWIRKIDQTSDWMTSVCTGSFLYLHAGLLNGRRATSHWSQIEDMRIQGKDKDVTVLDNARYVRDGKYVTSAGVSAGIDMALWVTGQVYGVETARTVQHFMEYDPAPPYAAAV